MTCYKYGPPPIDPDKSVQREYLDFQIDSQLLGFDIFLVTVAVTAIVFSVKQCCRKYNEKVIPELEVLDDYASYEANAARDYLEEMMRKTAEGNGRMKVKMLLEAKQPDLDKLDGLERALKAMSYDHFVATHNSLMNIYPKLYNSYDCRLQSCAIDEWCGELESFQHELQGIKEINYNLMGINGNIREKKKQNQKKGMEDEYMDDTIVTMSDGEHINLLDVQVQQKNYNAT